MSRRGIRKHFSRASWGVCVPITAGLALATAVPAHAADPLILPAGTACTFALQVDQPLADHRNEKFTDVNGTLVTTLSVGKGPNTTLTNLSNGNTLTLRGNGSGTFTTPTADGLFTVRAVGHTILILFPTDVPAGPSTTLVAGTIVYTRDADFNFTLGEDAIRGTTTDLCAAVA
jgi:hypothetical protein